MKKSKSTSNHFYKYMAFVLCLLSAIFLILIYFIGVFPLDYFLFFLGIVGVIDACLVFRLLKKGNKKIISCIFSGILSFAFAIGIVYEINTLDFLKLFGANNYITENYLVIVMDKSSYKDVKELKNRDMGVLKLDEDNSSAEEKLAKRVSVNYVGYNDTNKIRDALLDKEVEAILIEESFYLIIAEETENFEKETRIIYEFTVDILIEIEKDETDIINEPFSFYISGIDTYGTINSVARSDVNIVVSINPNTNKILITTIPRDYYVDLYDKNSKDKLTHAGVFGINTSQKSVEMLLDVKINYYIKVNFTSLINIVDALGGINVDSKYDFTSKDGYIYFKGNNNLNGEKALSFVRERKAFAGGDRVRGQNQQAVLVGMINKALDPSIIVKYPTLLKAVDGNFITNIDNGQVTNFIKWQIANKPTWNIESISLNGSDSYEYTYTSKSTKTYVMLPDENTLNDAISKIKNIYKG